MTDLYRDCLDFLYGRLNYERSGMPRTPAELRLGRMRRLLRALGDPHHGLTIVHVTGTKGKGSTASMIAAALSASGVKTGLFCSPHLHVLEERFVIDGQAATAAQLVELTEAVRPAVNAFDADAESDRRRGLTFFETTTAMGLLHFARQGTGAVVLEVGLGGRLDSTNVVRPAVSVITNISFDHTRQLGNTLGAIAREKAGIFKRGRPAINGESGEEARAVIREVARSRGCRYREVDRDFQGVYRSPARPLTRPSAGTLSVRTWARDWGTMDLPLFGAHQARNAAVALATLDALAESGGPEVGVQAVRHGFATLRVPARVELMGEAPWLVVDGSHNVASANALARTLETCFPDAPRTLVFGTTRDKDLPGQLRALLPGTETVIATRYVENPRAVPPTEVAEAVLELSGKTAIVTVEPAEALATALRETPSNGLICVTGSLFLAAETRDVVLGRTPSPSAGRVTT
ncbi:MAG: folylpolyglutamate synthase/dihydrofolate synthase family protein [Isosphaeraceae bacterium]